MPKRMEIVLVTGKLYQTIGRRASDNERLWGKYPNETETHSQLGIFAIRLAPSPDPVYAQHMPAKYTDQIQVKMTPQQRKLLVAAAKRAHLPLATYIRTMALNAAEKK